MWPAVPTGDGRSRGGLSVGKAFWGHGLATEAAQVSLQYGFETLKLESIVAIVHPENGASRRVIEKLGMEFVDQNHYFGMDVYRYSLDRSSYDLRVASRNGSLTE